MKFVNFIFKLYSIYGGSVQSIVVFGFMNELLFQISFSCIFPKVNCVLLCFNHQFRQIYYYSEKIDQIVRLSDYFY
jgi:hypothetical protein